MKVFQEAKNWIDYHDANSKKNTVRSYQATIDPFCQEFGDTDIDQVGPDDS